MTSMPFKEPSSRHILLSIAYDGTDFSGWQIQPNAPTIQGEVEVALEWIEKRSVRVRSSGRTDAGVHSCGHPAAFVTCSTIPLDGYRKGINARLPSTVSVQGAAEVPLSFDARRWHCRKTYRYSIYNSQCRNPFFDRYSWRVIRPLDVGAMKSAASHLVGTHDFTSFRAADCNRPNPVKTVENVEISGWKDFVFIDVTGPAFLKNMVRIMVGTLVSAGKGKITPGSVRDILYKRDRTLAAPTAPSGGLCLVRVFYHDLPPSQQPRSCDMKGLFGFSLP